MFSDGSWRRFVKQFAESVRHITGQNLEASLASDDHENILREELESLRHKIDELTGEVSTLRALFADAIDRFQPVRSPAQ